MDGTYLQRLREFVRRESVALLTIQPSDRPWQLPLAAAIASGVPVLAGACLGLASAGALGAVAGLSFLYLPETARRSGDKPANRGAMPRNGMLSHATALANAS